MWHLLGHWACCFEGNTGTLSLISFPLFMMMPLGKQSSWPCTFCHSLLSGHKFQDRELSNYRQKLLRLYTKLSLPSLYIVYVRYIVTVTESWLTQPWNLQTEGLSFSRKWLIPFIWTCALHSNSPSPTLSFWAFSIACSQRQSEMLRGIWTSFRWIIWRPTVA